MPDRRGGDPEPRAVGVVTLRQSLNGLERDVWCQEKEPHRYELLGATLRG
jgi:hypothetical protein